MKRIDVRRDALFAALPDSLCLPSALFRQTAAGSLTGAVQDAVGAVQTRSVGFLKLQQADFSRAAAKIKGRTAVAPIFDPVSGPGTSAGPNNTTRFPNNMLSKSWGIF